MSLVAEMSTGVRKGALIFLGNEFTLTFEGRFRTEHKMEYEVFVDLIRKVTPAPKFDARRWVWTFPASDAAIGCLRQIVAWGISPTTSAQEKLGVELKKIAEKEARQIQAVEQAVDLEIKGPAGPRLNDVLKNYQKAGVAFLSQVERGYLGDDMGLGKSLEALATVEHIRAYPVLIVCPVKLKQNWLRECRNWLPHRRASMLTNDLAEITILGYSEVHKYCNAGLGSPKARARKAAADACLLKRFFYPDMVRLSCVILDEAHWAKVVSSRRTMACLAIANECDARWRYCLSGTPVENRASELVAPLEFLGLMDKFGGWFEFVRRYCAARRTRFGWDTSGSSNASELHQRLENICYLRRKKTEVLRELPDKIETVIDVELSDRSEYDRIERDVKSFMVAQQGRLLSDGQAKAEAIIKLNLLRGAVGRAKVQWVVEWIDTFLESGEKFIVYAGGQSAQASLVSGLARWNPGVVLGGCTDVQREQDKFMRDGSCRVFIGSVKAAGFGLNLTVASHVGLLEYEWTSTKHHQVFDRAHRIGQKDCVNCYYFHAPDTVDDDMWDVVSAKAAIVASTTDGEQVTQEDVLKKVLRKYLSEPER